MSIKFGLKVFRKPKHWSKERYEEYLKEKGYYKTLKELRNSLKDNNNKASKNSNTNKL